MSGIKGANAGEKHGNYKRGAGMIIKLFEKRKDGRGLFVTKCKKCIYFTPHKDGDGGYCKKLSCYFSSNMFCGIGRKCPEDKLNERHR